MWNVAARRRAWRRPRRRSGNPGQGSRRGLTRPYMRKPSRRRRRPGTGGRLEAFVDALFGAKQLVEHGTHETPRPIGCCPIGSSPRGSRGPQVMAWRGRVRPPQVSRPRLLARAVSHRPALTTRPPIARNLPVASLFIRWVGPPGHGRVGLDATGWPPETVRSRLLEPAGCPAHCSGGSPLSGQ